MVITWFGLSCFKISSGNLTVVTDPFSKSVGLAPPRMQTDIAIISNLKNEAYNNRESLGGENIFVIDGPGEFDIKGFSIHGIAASGDPKFRENGFDYTTIYTLRIEDIRIAVLGSLKQKELSEKQLEDLGEIDVLLAPIGGRTVCDAEEAVTIVNQIEPSIVIPTHFAQKGLVIPYDKLEQFLKEIGATKTEPQEKLTLKKSVFQETKTATQVVVLSSQR